jgi:hypothetical protein
MQPYLLALNSAFVTLASIPVYIAALILAAPIILFLKVPILTDILILPYRLLHALGLFKKKHIWSVVYDSKTKLPIDPAYVTVRNTLGVEVASVITDINGRFSLILPRGIYTIDVQKTNYAFPSFEMKRATNDGSYSNLYYGEKINVVGTEQPLAIAIPMDQTGSDWNEAQKKKLNLFSRFGKQQLIVGSEYLYLIIGVLLAMCHFVLYRDVFSMNLSFAYFGLIVLRVFWYVIMPSQYAHSVVVDRHSGMPLAFARVSLYSAAMKRKLVTKTTSFEGQFTVLLPKGRYYAAIEGRDASGNYSLLHTSSEFYLDSGYLGRKFSV